MAGKLKKEIINAFKFRGLNLRAEGVDYLVEVLSATDAAGRPGWLDKIINSVTNSPLESGTIEENSLKNAVEDCSQNDDDNDEALCVIDAFSVPRLDYEPNKKKFIPCGDSGGIRKKKLHLHGSVDSKANLYLNRYHIVHQRTLRHELFTPTNFMEEKMDTQKYKLSKIEDLMAIPGRVDAVVLGMLTQLKGDKFFLEDPTGTVELDLSDTQFHDGLFSENSVILVEGWHQDRVLHTTAVGFSPIELAPATRSHFGNINFFGGPGKNCAKASMKLRIKEASNPDATILFASDVWLDDHTVLDRLRTLFSGFADSPPVCIVFAGSFCSKPYGIQQIDSLRDGFSALADLLRDFPELTDKTTFVFVPSLRDPVLGNILPRPGLPNSVVGPVMKRIPKCFFATNPCRLQYCSQEIVVFREDLVEKICRNCIRMPSARKDIPEHFAKTLKSQSHLCPLPLHVAPMYWEYEHALRLYPLPDLIVICDNYDPFTVSNKKHGDAIVTNPGSFSRNKFGFQVYIPASRVVEDSSIAD